MTCLALPFLACLSAYALHRLARLLTRMEQEQAHSLAAQLTQGEEPTYSRAALLRDAAAALLLSLLFLACLFFAFAL